MKISYQSIKEILTPNELRNVTGGSVGNGDERACWQLQCGNGQVFYVATEGYDWFCDGAGGVVKYNPC